MRQMVKNVRGNAECVTCHPFAYIKLGGVLDWKLGDGSKTKECRANATVSRWKLERQVLGTGDDFCDTGSVAHDYSANPNSHAARGWAPLRCRDALDFESWRNGSGPVRINPGVVA